MLHNYTGESRKKMFSLKTDIDQKGSCPWPKFACELPKRFSFSLICTLLS